MSIRDILKGNKTMRKVGKALNIYREFFNDAREFSHSYIESAEDKKDYRYSILLIVHSLEKGMCMTTPRPFGGARLTSSLV